MSNTPLVCPNCEHAESLYSIEKAEILYPVRPERRDTGVVTPGYTGEHRHVIDEGTVFTGEFVCRACFEEFTTADLIEPPTPDEDDEDEDE